MCGNVKRDGRPFNPVEWVGTPVLFLVICAHDSGIMYMHEDLLMSKFLTTHCSLQRRFPSFLHSVLL